MPNEPAYWMETKGRCGREGMLRPLGGPRLPTCAGTATREPGMRRRRAQFTGGQPTLIKRDFTRRVVSSLPLNPELEASDPKRRFISDL